MSDHPTVAEHRLGYLLLRDGHAVPLRGVTPDDIKAGAKYRVPHPDAEPLRHRQTLDAIIDRLGFDGDHGTYLKSGWPSFLAFLKKNHCTHRIGVFPVDHGGCIDLYFGSALGPGPRQLADRVFEARTPPPARVFTGYGVDWSDWDRGYGFDVPEAAIAAVGGDAATARQRAQDLFARRHDLTGQWGFLDDKLIAGPVRHVVDKTYWLPSASDEARRESHAKVVAATAAFRAVFDAQDKGWVDVLRFNDRLVVLRGYDGGWDVLWRCYREDEPPDAGDVGDEHHLAIDDLPITLHGEADLRRAVHFRQEVWEELEAHEALQSFYDRGGSSEQRRMMSEADLRVGWLRAQGRFPAPERVRWDGPVPDGFRAVEVGGRRLAVSAPVELGAFRRMIVETGYLGRRAPRSESWKRANDGVPDSAPVGATWADAQAFCAWKERQLGVAVRLPTRAELRALRPIFSAHYASMSDLDFPWENHPPRPLVGADGRKDGRDVPSAVAWSEPRFLEPTPDRPEFPSASGVSTSSRKRWIEDFPPRAPWRDDLEWAEHAGLPFIDAWDAYEWCQEQGWINGRFWEGHIGATSWGAYKNVKVTFRLVLDLGE